MSTKTYHTDIIIFGAGIAGLWAFHRFKRMGYSPLLLETNAIGGGQTIASQGIIHSGLKYAFAGKVSKLAQSISAMPDLWRAALAGRGDVDLSAARVSAESQFLMIPNGLMGGLVKLVTRKILGDGVRECDEADWPEEIKATGFKGSVVFMDEPVLDVPSLLRALAEPYRDSIRQVDWNKVEIESDGDGIAALMIDGHKVTADRYIFTAAGSNHEIAKTLGHDKGLTTQKRPLLQGIMKNAPYEMYAHLVGTSDKPVASITTHKASDGSLVWYIGGGAAERDVDAPEGEVFDAIRKGFAQYLPSIDLSTIEWATLPIHRIEGKSDTQGWMPDTPVIHDVGNVLYCWPTKLTFAPMLSNMLVEKLEGVEPCDIAQDWSFLPRAEYAQTPWDEAKWKKDV